MGKLGEADMVPELLEVPGHCPLSWLTTRVSEYRLHVSLSSLWGGPGECGVLLPSGSSWARSKRPGKQGHNGSGGYKVRGGVQRHSEPPAFPVMAPRLIAQVWEGTGLSIPP